MADREIAWADLHQKQQENLDNFLNTDLDIAVTFCGMAESQRSPERRAELGRKIQTAIDTIRLLARKIEDRSRRKIIFDRLKDLECRMEGL